jgi:hypothetical protein
LFAVLARNLLLVGSQKRAAVHDLLAADVEPIDPMRPREDEAGDQVLGAAELERIRLPNGDIGALARLERA